MIHANSVKSYRTFKRGQRQSDVFDVYVKSRVPLTDREVAERLGFFDMNAVRPSITKLIEIGKVAEVGETTDETTGKTVRCCTNRVMV